MVDMLTKTPCDAYQPPPPLQGEGSFGLTTVADDEDGFACVPPRDFLVSVTAANADAYVALLASLYATFSANGTGAAPGTAAGSAAGSAVPANNLPASAKRRGPPYLSSLSSVVASLASMAPTGSVGTVGSVGAGGAGGGGSGGRVMAMLGQRSTEDGWRTDVAETLKVYGTVNEIAL